MFVVLNEATIDKIIREFMNNSFFGFKRENVLFLAQKKYHGINAPKRLHNQSMEVSCNNTPCNPPPSSYMVTPKPVFLTLDFLLYKSR